MYLSKQCLFLISVFYLLSITATANDEKLWQDRTFIAARGTLEHVKSNNKGVENARTLTLNTELMKSILQPAERGQNLQARSVKRPIVELPLPDGSNIKLSLERINILPSSLAKKFPDIITYKIAEPNGDVLSGRVDMTDHGFHAMLQTFDGQTLFIDPASKDTSLDYLSYRKSEQSSKQAFQCNTPEAHQHEHTPLLQRRFAARVRSNEGLIEYRIAIAATSEYSQLQGGTVSGALSSIVTTLNRVNHVYEQSLGIRLSLIEENDKLIYTDSGSDPYSNYNIERMLDENQRNIDRVIGSANYDIGHVFGTSGGGLAYIGRVCDENSKARGASGTRNPNNDSFDIDYVAHEIGHQLGATHTFNGNQGICTSGARTARTAFEPGSGSSIMSYAGGCGTDDLQSFADAMFHSGNIEQINKNVTRGPASACGVVHQTSNTAPMAIAGNNYIIPAHTPFELTAKAIDAENDVLRYSWEQIDAGTASTLKIDTGNNPLFRILPPSEHSTRSFPAVSTILGNAVIKGESLPSTTRTMNFQVAVYDGHHVPSLDRMSINVVNSGEAFKLQSTDSHYTQGKNIDINWNTANTQSSPINCASVDFHLSIDGGKKFDIVLAKGIPNSGKATIFLSDNLPSTNSGRFKISCSDNIFFSISSASFTVSQNTPPPTTGTRGGNNANSTETNTKSGGGSISIILFIFLSLIGLLSKSTKGAKANQRPSEK